MYHQCHIVLCSSKIRWHQHSPIFLSVYLNFSDAYLFCLGCSLSYCSVSLTRHHDQGNLRKEVNWELACSFRGLVHDHHDAWFRSQWLHFPLLSLVRTVPESSHLWSKFHLAGRAKTEFMLPGPGIQLLSCFLECFLFVFYIPVHLTVIRFVRTRNHSAQRRQGSVVHSVSGVDWKQATGCCLSVLITQPTDPTWGFT